MTGAEWFGSAPGGLNRYFTDLFAALRAHPGTEVSAVAFGDPPSGARSWGRLGGSTVRRVTRSVVARPAARRPGVLDRHFCLYGPPAAGAARGQRLVVHFHGPWAAESRLAGESECATRAKYLVERMRYAGAERFVVLSEEFRRVLVSDYRVAEERVEVIAPGVDLDRFAVAAPPDSAQEPVVLCIRRLERRMGIDRLLRAWPAVLSARPDARLVIIGTGSAERELRELAASSGLQHSVTFAGHVRDERLAAHYARACCTVVPSVALEGFGLIALESLACGRAPIVTDCGGLPDAVRGLDPSLIVAADDVDALAARIAAALAGALPTAQSCRAHAESFSWAAAAARHHTLYTELHQ
ncbi:glycosyltransferase [Nocardia brasiliensis]|uniref:Glycosyltransferase n=1 Tax=Nocardia brasiliensis TaxID=37326 RepID=A0A6G9Y2U3_NOCBR|nr:glycosyltransferase family 4 protein [Nocardia brasiliensis]QIS07407.1 glycosyltransferase [Nocardia brasiliensis]